MESSALLRCRSRRDRLFEIQNPFTAESYTLSNGSNVYKSTTIFFLLFLLATYAVPLHSQFGWFWQYPKPQGNMLWDIYALNQNTAFAVGQLGSIVKTTNGGITWETVHFLGGTNLDVFFLDNQHGWVTSGSVVLETTDGGETWLMFLERTEPPFAAVYFLNQDTGWVTGYGFIKRTTDHGATWTETEIRQWDDFPTLSSICFTDDKNGWCTGYGFWGNEVYKTTDGGESWNQVTGFDPIVCGFTDIQFVNRDTGWACSGLGKILKTTNGGMTWSVQRDTMVDFYYSLAFVSPDTGWVAGVRGISDRIGLVYFTTNGGQTWSRQDSGFLGPLYSVDYEEGVVWVAGDDGCIYKSTDFGTSWITFREPLHTFKSIHFANEDIGWAVGEGVILRTSDGGENWAPHADIPSNYLLRSVHACNPEHVYIAGTIELENRVYKGVYLRSSDRGITWTEQIFDDVWSFQSVFFVNDSLGWMTATSGRIFETTNGGITWSLTSLIEGGGTFEKIQFVNESIGRVAAYRGCTMYLTEDGGTTWSGHLIDSNMILRSFHFVSSTTGWAVGDYHYQSNIFKTTDGGRHWSMCNSPQIADYLAVQFIDENRGWIIGDDYLNSKPVIYATKDGGNSWIDQKCVMQGRVSSLFFLNEVIGWVVGKGILKTDKGIIGSVNNPGGKFSENHPRNFLLFQNYPNPFNPNTIIKYRVDKSEVVSLKIFDVLGRHVSTLVAEEALPGEYSVMWDASGFTSGVYFYRLQVGSSIETKKMVLLR